MGGVRGRLHGGRRRDGGAVVSEPIPLKPTATVGPTCQSCAHFRYNQQDLTRKNGFCFRYPPIPYPVGMTPQGPAGVMNCVPTVGIGDFCGEWSAGFLRPRGN